MAKIALGHYVRITSAARVDVIGKVVRHTKVGYVVRIPKWTADGCDSEWTVQTFEVERSSAVACERAARRRS